MKQPLHQVSLVNRLSCYNSVAVKSFEYLHNSYVSLLDIIDGWTVGKVERKQTILGLVFQISKRLLFRLLSNRTHSIMEINSFSDKFINVSVICPTLRLLALDQNIWKSFFVFEKACLCTVLLRSWFGDVNAVLNPNPCGWGRIWLPKLWRGITQQWLK